MAGTEHTSVWGAMGCQYQGRWNLLQMVWTCQPGDTEGAERGLGVSVDRVGQGWVGIWVVDGVGKYGYEARLGKQLQETNREHLQFLK